MNRRLLGYLLINILVSAAVIITILIFYDRHFRSATPPSLPNSSTQGIVDIVAIAGIGQLDKEEVSIRNTGQASLSLDAWALKAASGAQYIFPELTLLPGGSVTVHTAAGHDTATDLYWGLADPVWSSDELATLADAGGAVRAAYRIP
jgi:competence protein ComEC